MGAKTVLLTGGAGYIGSHTAVELLEQGYDVVIADDLRGCEESVLSRIGQITGRVPELCPVNVADRAALEEVFEQYELDAVIHLAGLKAVGASVKKPLAYYRNNLDATLTLLETMAYHNVKKLVFSSSATVYGEPWRIPLTEDMATGGVNPYGWSKYMIERILTDTATADSALSVVILRYFNPIGAHPSGLIGEQSQGVPDNLLPYITGVAAGRLGSLHVFGDDYPTPDGTGVRDYLHVVDLARGHLAALRYADRHTGAEVFNLGTGHGCTVLELVKAFESATGTRVPYVIEPRRAGDVAAYCADTAKAQSLLGWTAERGLEEMCRDAWRWEQRRQQ